MYNLGIGNIHLGVPVTIHTVCVKSLFTLFYLKF